MVCTTFLSDSELNVPTSNDDLNELLKEVRKVSGEDWQITERMTELPVPAWKFWAAREFVKTYELFVYVGGCGPWQQINFYRDGSDYTINIRNRCELVMAYLYGIVAGVHSQRNAESSTDDKKVGNA
jgi:hypothetical protein